MPIICLDRYKARRGSSAVATAENASQRPGRGSGEHLARQPHTTPDHLHRMLPLGRLSQGRKKIRWKSLPQSRAWALPGSPDPTGFSQYFQTTPTPSKISESRDLILAPPVSCHTLGPAPGLGSRPLCLLAPGREQGSGHPLQSASPGLHQGPPARTLSKILQSFRAAPPGWSWTRALTVDSLSPTVEGDQRQK